MADAVEADWESAPISEKRRAMLEYSSKLTRSPGEVSERDIEPLRDVGFSDTDILHIAEVVAYFAYANRIADGLGIPLEDWIPEEDGSKSEG